MKFMVSCDDADAVEVPAVAGNDRTFTAETKVPFCGEASATVHMKKGDTEYIQSVTGLHIENNEKTEKAKCSFCLFLFLIKIGKALILFLSWRKMKIAYYDYRWNLWF